MYNLLPATDTIIKAAPVKHNTVIYKVIFAVSPVGVSVEGGMSSSPTGLSGLSGLSGSTDGGTLPPDGGSGESESPGGI